MTHDAIRTKFTIFLQNSTFQALYSLTLRSSKIFLRRDIDKPVSDSKSLWKNSHNFDFWGHIFIEIFFSMKTFFFSKISELKMTFSGICFSIEKLENLTFLSFSLFVERLRLRMVMWLVSIESPDVFEANSCFKSN